MAAVGLHKIRASRLWARMRCERGVATVEFALILPVLLLLMFGMVDLGRFINRDIDQTHLANEGARVAAVNGPPAASLATLATYLKNQQDAPATSQVCVKFPSGTTVGSPVTITVKSTFDFIPFVYTDATDGPHHALRSDSTMRLEQAPTASMIASNNTCV